MTSDPIADIIGDYRAFAAMQRYRLEARGIDIAPYALSQPEADTLISTAHAIRAVLDCTTND